MGFNSAFKGLMTNIGGAATKTPLRVELAYALIWHVRRLCDGGGYLSTLSSRLTKTSDRNGLVGLEEERGLVKVHK